MNSSWLATNVLWQTAGWTMLHFLWIGGVIAVLVAMIDRAVRRCSPEVCYVVAVTQFFIVAAIPCCLFMWNLSGILGTEDGTIKQTAEMEKNQPPTNHAPRELEVLPPPVEIVQNPDRADSARVASNTIREDSREPSDRSQRNAERKAHPASPESPLRFIMKVGETVTHWLTAILPWIWVVGFPLTCSTLLIGVSGAERLRCRCQILGGTHVAVTICHRLQTALNLRKEILIGVTDSISAPILVGIIRPLILFPTSTLAGISTEQLEMILLHELAHVRRWDNLINLMQRVVEAVLFFHPVIWWLSNRVRLEREHCCDAAVLAHVRVPQAYAEMLVQMALANTPSGWVMGTSITHQLIPRIRRILNQEEDRMQVSRKMIVASLSALLSLTILTVVYAQRDPVKPENKPAAIAADVKANTTSKKQTRFRIQISPTAPKNLTRFKNRSIRSNATIHSSLREPFSSWTASQRAAAKFGWRG